MTPALWFLLGAAYPVSVIVSARWLDFVQGDDVDRIPAGVGMLSPIVLTCALVWLLCFSHRKAGK